MLKLCNRYAPGLAVVFIIIVWELACRVFEIPVFVLPRPSEVVAAAVQQPLNKWISSVWATLEVVLIGFSISFVVSIPLSIVLVNSRLLSRTIIPLLVIIQSTPVVAIAPILVVTMGTGMLPRVAITCLITFFPLVVSTVAGLRATPEELIDLSRSLRAPRWRQFQQIRIPYAIPYILSATKISVTLAVIGAVVAEFVASNDGLGYMIQYSTSLFKVPTAFASLFALLCISLTLYRAVVIVERVFFSWSLPKNGGD